MLRTLGAYLLKPRFGLQPLVRGFGSDSKPPGADVGPLGGPEMFSKITGTNETKESMQEQIDKLMSPEAASGPGQVYENVEYTRNFHPKSTYHPHELDEGYAKKSRNKFTQTKKTWDPFVALDLDPLKAYKNASLLSNFVTDMGKIKPRYKTGLTPKSQRRVAQAIKRARAFGLIPVTSRLGFVSNSKAISRGARYA
ncbi:hypothetical protein IWW39_001144 [Coemansia spiralis]|uniref:Small ribosomal subunit protein bS18m n=1 Tax=Coemansia spiralis TaxID=417178 RepID=A0A9W8GQP8_9FUNG|nr:hypothetical protein IWW39_001144 [Coemansia spiralis]